MMLIVMNDISYQKKKIKRQVGAMEYSYIERILKVKKNVLRSWTNQFY